MQMQDYCLLRISVAQRLFDSSVVVRPVEGLCGLYSAVDGSPSIAHLASLAYDGTRRRSDSDKVICFDRQDLCSVAFVTLRRSPNPSRPHSLFLADTDGNFTA